MKALFLLLLAAVSVDAAALSGDGPLLSYVHQADDAFRWVKRATIHGAGYTAHVIDLHSQRWLTAEDVDRTLWQHWLTIVVPDQVLHDKALLLVQHRNNTDEPPAEIDEIQTAIALATNSVVAGIAQVPNQPLTFTADPNAERRTEDDLIAFAQAQFLQNQDPAWLPRFPMVKATMRAMDAVQAFMAGEGNHPIKEFVVAGASKRGWTTWLVGAVDDRVCGIIPIVIDVLNVVPSMDHQRAVYGGWSPALAPYINSGIMERLHSPEFRALLDLVDPYMYRDDLTMPKYMINATGDQLFVPDSSQFYFPALLGEKHLRYLPNMDHNVDETDSVLAMYHLILLGKRRPEVTWDTPSGDTLRVHTDTKPSEVSMWQAHNPDGRDFRLETVGPIWTEEDIPLNDTGDYVLSLPRAGKGWMASFVELRYELGAAAPFVVTTEVFVRPQE